MNMQVKNKKLARVKTGVKGLDNFIEGGFPNGANIVVTGNPGTGKSIFGMAFINEGCKNSEKCLYIIVEQSPNEIVEQAMQFNWDFRQWENNGNLKFVGLDFRELSEMKTYNEIRQIIEDSQYDRMVIDSLTSFALSPAPISSIDGAISVQQRAVLNEIIRTNVVSIYDIAKKHGVTTVSISQKVEGMPGDTVDNVSEFIGDGLVLMNFTEMGKSLNRTIQVKKMRKTKINGVSHSFDFTNEGIVVKS